MGVGGLVGLTSVTVHPSGELIAATTVINRLMLWDVQSGEVIKEAVLPEIGQPGYKVDFTADGSHLICSGKVGDRVTVVSVPDLREVHHEAESLSLKPEFPVTVRMVKVGEARFPVEPDLAWLRDRPPITRDGSLIALTRAGDDPTLRVVSVRDKSEVFSTPLGDPPSQVGFSSNGKMVYAITRPAVPKGTAPPPVTFRRWDVSSKTLLGTVEGIENLFAISPDLGRSLERVNGIEIYSRDLSTGRRAEAPFAVEAGLRGAAFFPDGEHVATFGGQNSTKAWKMSRTLKVPENLLFRTDHPRNLLVSPDGRRIAFSEAPARIGIFELDRRRTTHLAVNLIQRMPVVPTMFSPDGRSLFVASMMDHGLKSLAAFDVESGGEVKISPMPGEVRPPGSSPKDTLRSQLLAFLADSNSRMLYFLHRTQAPNPRAAGSSPSYLLWEGQEARMPAAFAETLTVPAEAASNDSGRGVRTLPETFVDLSIASFSPQGNYLAYLIPARTRRDNGSVGKLPPEVVILGTADGQVVSRVSRWAGRIESIGFTQDETTLIFHVNQGKPGQEPTRAVVGFDRQTGRETFRAAGPQPGFLALSSDGRRLATIGADGTIVIESLPEKAEVARISLDDGPMSPVAFLTDGTKLITSGANAAVRLWDLPSESKAVGSR